MKNLVQIRDRFIQDRFEVRMGGLAANLARIASFSGDVRHREPVHDLIVESEYFSEWTAMDAETLAIKEYLVELQVALARWQIRVRGEWSSESSRTELAAASKKWSDEVLEISGLLTSGAA